MKVLNLQNQNQYLEAFWIQKLNVKLQLVQTDINLKFWWGKHDHFQLVLLGEDRNAEIMKSLSEIPLEVRELGSADHVLQQNFHWWARNAFAAALKDLMIQRLPELRTHQYAYVTGSNLRAVNTVITLIKMGFRKIKTTMSDECTELLDKLTQRTFGVEIVQLDPKTLLTQASDGSLLVNCVSETDDQETFNEICFFNFLATGSAVVDAQKTFQSKKLTTEGEAVGHKIVMASDIQARTDFLILQNFKSLPNLSWDEYLTQWNSFLNSQSSS